MRTVWALSPKKMVQERAREIAKINGRRDHQVLDSDLEEARRELTGEEILEATPTAAENLTEDERWEEVAESKMKRAETVPAPDEQTFAEKLVEEGVGEAEHDQMRGSVSRKTSARRRLRLL